MEQLDFYSSELDLGRQILSQVKLQQSQTEFI